MFLFVNKIFKFIYNNLLNSIRNHHNPFLCKFLLFLYSFPSFYDIYYFSLIDYYDY